MLDRVAALLSRRIRSYGVLTKLDLFETGNLTTDGDRRGKGTGLI
jgi:hypothetical protein